MDMKTVVDSLKDNIKEKTTNPFFGSLIVVWSIHNWRFLYKIFNFSSAETTDQRISFIASYLDPSSFLPNLAWCIVLAFLVLISTYFLLNLSRLIVNFYEKMVTPIIYKVTDKSSIVTKDEYNRLKLEKDQMGDRLDAERKNRVSLQNDLADLETRYANLQIELEKSQSQSTTNTDTTTPAPSKTDIFTPNEDEIELLKFLSMKEPNKVAESEVANLFKNTTRRRHYLSELRAHNYILSEGHTMSGQMLYWLSEPGRSFLVKKSIV